MDTRPSVTITLTRYAEPDWLVLQALESLSGQRGISAEVLFLDQAPTATVARRCQAMSSARIDFKHESIPAISLSFARNEAIRRATSDCILFIDADAVAEPDWAAALAECLAVDSVGVAGTRILPRWHGRPLVIARSRVVLDQYSVYDLGQDRRFVNRVVGASFGTHRGRMGVEARFYEQFSRRNGILFSGDDSDLCRRARLRGLKVIYEGSAVVHHQILPERISYRWVLQRFFYAGVGRARLGGSPSPSNVLGVWDYLVLPVVLPSYLAGYLYGKRLSRH